MTVVVPGLPPASVLVTVTASGQTGTGSTFTVMGAGAVYLAIELTSTDTVTVAWPWPSTGWNLEQNTDLNPTSWASPPQVINHDGTNQFILVNPPASNRFYRLRKP